MGGMRYRLPATVLWALVFPVLHKLEEESMRRRGRLRAKVICGQSNTDEYHSPNPLAAARRAYICYVRE
jgi:hypothetical protein